MAETGAEYTSLDHFLLYKTNYPLTNMVGQDEKLDMSVGSPWTRALIG